MSIIINSTTKKLLIIFISAFILNAVWEHLHSVLYLHYKGEEIMNYMLFRSALFDAFIITVFAHFFKNIWCIVVVSIFFAVGLEFWALNVGRWAYTDSMPLMFGIGLTPAIQLGLLAYISVKISIWKKL